jgi:signal transduction histidine kinase
MTDQIIVLYIDDEDNNLNSFKASLRKDFKVVTAQSAAEGLQIAAEQELHVVIADIRMPGMDGIEFFEKLMKLNPDAVRILLTGYSDIASVIDAINRGQVYRFIDKPWNIETVKNAIVNAGEIYFTRKELKVKNERLEKINSEMNQFVYTLSHELRGPLMSISGVSKLARLESKDPNVLEYFDMIDLAMYKLDEYIFKMLDFYRSTKLENKLAEIDFSELVRQQIDGLSSKWDLSLINVKIEIKQNQAFHSDDSKLRVILGNLLNNACQFQRDEIDSKQVKVGVLVEDGQAVISVADNGVGIEKEYREDVFDLFQRATQKSVGSGLGLYMVKEAVYQLGGKILLESEVDNGTTVKVTLPSLQSSEPA